MSYYSHHLFFCTNQRNDGRRSCQDCDSQALRDYAKQRCKTNGLSGKNKIQVNTAGCLNRCSYGPVMVVYPEAIWYTVANKKDIDDIIKHHCQAGNPVKRLMIDKV